jgi:hypothetical protein
VWEYHPDFNILNPGLETSGHLVRGRVGEAATMCIDAQGLVDLALRKLESDRWYFVGRPPAAEGL